MPRQRLMHLKVSGGWQGTGLCALPVWADRSGPGALQWIPCSSAAIEADGRDMKALFRRSQALQKLGRLDQAVSDLQRCVSLEPKNKAFQEALRALGSSMHEKVSGEVVWGLLWPSHGRGGLREAGEG